SWVEVSDLVIFSSPVELGRAIHAACREATRAERDSAHPTVCDDVALGCFDTAQPPGSKPGTLACGGTCSATDGPTSRVWPPPPVPAPRPRHSRRTDSPRRQLAAEDHRPPAAIDVQVDGVRRFVSPVLRGASASQTVQLDIAGASRLTLTVDGAGDGIDFDHADWAAARVVCAP